MTNEQKQLLLKDLCARLPYKINLLFEGKYKGNLDTISVLDNNVYINAYDLYASVIDGYSLEDTKPYLRPMSSMTEREKENVLKILFDKDSNLFYIDKDGVIEGYETTDFLAEGINIVSFCPRNIELYADWLNEHHFDYRGLIPMGLALEAPEDMYKEE